MAWRDLSNASLIVVASAHPVIVSANSPADPPAIRARPVVKGNVASVAHLETWARAAFQAYRVKMAKRGPWWVKDYNL